MQLTMLSTIPCSRISTSYQNAISNASGYVGGWREVKKNGIGDAKLDELGSGSGTDSVCGGRTAVG